MLGQEQSHTPEFTEQIESLAAPPWTADSTVATDKLAFGLDQGFIAELRFYWATNQIGIVDTNKHSQISKFDFELEVFREILNNFVKDATVEGENRFQRQGSVYYSTPDDTERRILLQSDYYSPAGKDGSRADWPIVAVRLVDGGSSMSPESRALMLVGEPAVEVVRKIKAAHDIEALKYQIEDQLEALTLKGAAEPHVLVKGRNGFERIVIEGLNSDLAAYEAVEHLEDHMTGLAFRIFDYQKENDPLSLPRWGIEVTRRRAA